MREREIEKTLVKMVRKNHGLAWKFISPGLAGVPDRIVMFEDGKLGFIELKRPGGIMRVLQQKRKAQLEELGFQVFCVDSKEQIGGIIDAIKNRI